MNNTLKYSYYLPMPKTYWLVLFMGVITGIMLIGIPIQYVGGIFFVIAVGIVFFLNPFYGAIIFLLLRSSLSTFSVSEITFLGFTPAAWLGILFILFGVAYTLVYKASIIKAEPIAIPFLLFVIWSSIVTLRSPTLSAGFYSWSKLVSEFLIFLIVANIIYKDSHIRKLILALFVASIIPSIVGIYQLIVIDPALQTSPEVWGAERVFYRIRGTFSHAMEFADFLAVMIVFSSILLIEFYQRLTRCFKAILAGLLSCWGVLLISTYTRSAWIAVVAAIFLYSLIRKRYKLLLVFAGSILLISYLFPDVIFRRFQDVLHPSEFGTNTLLGRFNLWKIAFMNMTQDVVVGKGLGAFLKTSVRELGYGWAIHNIYMQALYELGIVGFLLLAWLQFSILKCAIWNYRKLGSAIYRTLSLAFIITYIACGIITPLAANRLGSPGVNWYIYLLCGMMTRLSAIERRGEIENRTIF